jgi:hypothetical protein
MDSLNTILNSGTYGENVSRHNDNNSKIKQAITTLENVAIANKGYFDTLASLQAAFPSPKAGNIAYVANVASSTGYYIYNVVAGVWTATTTEAPAVGVDLNNYATKKKVDDIQVELSYESDTFFMEFEKGSINSTSGVFGDTDLRIRAKLFGFNVGNVIRVVNNSALLDTFGLFKFNGDTYIGSTGVGNAEITIDGTFDTIWCSFKKLDGFSFSDLDVEYANANINFVVTRGDTGLKTKIRDIDTRVTDIDYSDKLTVLGYGVSSNSGEYISSPTVDSTPFLECFGYNIIQLTVIENTGVTTYGIAFYDNTKTFISGISRVVGVANSFQLLTYDIPENAYFFVTCYWNSTGTPLGGSFSCKLLSIMSSRINNIGRGGSVFSGKSIHTFGSSNLTDQYGTWSQDLSLALGMTLTTSSVAGAKFAMASSGVNNSLVKQVEDYVFGSAAPDIIIISSGLNDSWWSPATPIGDFELVKTKTLAEIRGSYSSDFGVNTFYGSLRYIVETLQGEYQDAFIILCIPWQCWPERAASFEPYIQPLKDIAMYFSIPVIDSFSEGGISRAFESSGAYGRYTIDGIHIKNGSTINASGRRLQSNFIIDRFVKCFYSKI